ncbi:copper-binding protein [Atopomonas hussainii]|uniref:copper-binding protein n=1 Tax=Atopomonas hussainii TaxID=1429083 RepID=UPI0009000082|nr:copper-binding protein [Atopomonas hussainii]
MKKHTNLLSVTLVAGLIASPLLQAQQDEHAGHGMMQASMHAEGHGMDHGDMGMAGEGEGVIKALLPDRKQVVIDHEPVASHNWPKMTMGFAVTDAKLLEGLSVGDKVSFKFTAKGMNGVISAITKQ